VDLSQLSNDVLSIARPEIVSKQIKVRQSLPSNLIVQTNRSEIQQVLLNLLNNAIQALASSKQADKEIVIEGRFTGSGVELSIADNGDGVPLQAQANLFELLVDSQKKGMGLGLWLCKHIVMRHGGTIRYEPNLLSGARFIIELPIQSKAI
jgi:signal transduction histidine kinase